MSFDITGKITKIYDFQKSKNDNEKWDKQGFMIETQEGNFTKKVYFVAKGRDNCLKLQDMSIDDAVKVYFNVEGNEWQEKPYATISAWKIEKLS